MDTYEAITTRRTVRLYEQKALPPVLLERIVNSGRVAPSGGNVQALEFIIVRQNENCDKLFGQLAWAAYVKPKRNPPEGKRPSAYVILLVRGNGNHDSDAGAAMENMILTAWNEGVGSCWIGSVQRDKVKELFEIPDEYHVYGVLALGYPAEKPVMETAEDSIKYWLDGADRLHVPKRRLGEILHHEKF